MIAKFRYHSENSTIAKNENFAMIVIFAMIVKICYAIVKLPIFYCILQASSSLLFLHFSSLLSSWSLIYDVEFDSNSSCLDRFNNIGRISSQKLQNLPQNMISRIVGTLMCKSG